MTTTGNQSASEPDPDEFSWIDDFISQHEGIILGQFKVLRLSLYEQYQKDATPSHFLCGIFSSLDKVKGYLETAFPFPALKKGMTFRLTTETVDEPWNPSSAFAQYEI